MSWFWTVNKDFIDIHKSIMKKDSKPWGGENFYNLEVKGQGVDIKKIMN